MTPSLIQARSGKCAISLEDLSLTTLFTRITVPIPAAADDKGVHFSCDLSNMDGIYVRAHGLNAQKIFPNLLSNVVKFTPAGGQVSCRAGAYPGACAHAQHRYARGCACSACTVLNAFDAQQLPVVLLNRSRQQVYSAKRDTMCGSTPYGTVFHPCPSA